VKDRVLEHRIGAGADRIEDFIERTEPRPPSAPQKHYDPPSKRTGGLGKSLTIAKPFSGTRQHIATRTKE
jgi:hypothetical protein